MTCTLDAGTFAMTFRGENTEVSDNVVLSSRYWCGNKAFIQSRILLSRMEMFMSYAPFRYSAELEEPSPAGIFRMLLPYMFQDVDARDSPSDDASGAVSAGAVVKRLRYG